MSSSSDPTDPEVDSTTGLAPPLNAAASPPAGRGARFRAWRQARPFWAGLWTILGGLVIVGIPLSDPPAFLAAGSTGVTAALPGVVLVAAGAFMWFSPPNRTLAGVLAVTFAVASFLLSNFGGFVVGMLLGLLGGAMALAWTDKPRRRRARRGRSHQKASVLVAIVIMVAAGVTALQATPGVAGLEDVTGTVEDVAQSGTDAAVEPSAQDLLELLTKDPDTPEDLPEGDRETAEPESAEESTRQAATPRVRAQAAGHDDGHVAPLLRSLLDIPDLDVTNFTYEGVVSHPTVDGSVDALRFNIGTIDAQGLQIKVPVVGDRRFNLGHADGTHLLGEGVVLDCTEITITLQGARDPILGVFELPLPFGVPLTFRASEPNDPLLLALAGSPGLDLTVTDVHIDLVTLSLDTLTIPMPRADVT